MMKNPFVWFWMLMIFLSIAWYGVFLFYVGIKGGYEIVQMTRNLSRRPKHDPSGQRLPHDEQ